MPSITGRVLPTLQKRGAPLAASSVQRARLDGAVATAGATFESALAGARLFPLHATGVEIFQINVGRKCNQTCRHCHVDAGPDRTEMMPDHVMDQCLHVIESADVQVVDITGGAPELHKRWRELVERSTAAGKRVMDRCNLTIAQLPNYRYLPAFFAQHRVEVVASLPHYRAKNTDSQRGDGVFEDSLATLRELNQLGYGQPGSGLSLTLVANPVGTYLPGNQAALESDWRRQLRRLYGVEFTNLFTITNMPISRFLDHLEETGQTDEYLTRLVTAFNPAAAANVMCRNTLSVGWDGTLYDCDFNQMLEMPLHAKAPQTIFEWDRARLDEREVAVGAHCFGCTAGAGSSCGGATQIDSIPAGTD